MNWKVAISLASALVLATARAIAGSAADCKHADVQRVRSAANKLMSKKDYQGAVATLRSLDKECVLGPRLQDSTQEPSATVEDYFWWRSDLAFALYKAGAYVECQRVTAPLTTSRPPTSVHEYFDDDTKIAKAIEFNQGLCQTAYKHRFADFVTAPCPQVRNASVEVPASMVSTPGCLALDKPLASYKDKDQADDPDPSKVCASVRFRGKHLTVDKGPLVATEMCCNIESLSVGTLGGKLIVRVTGGGRNCFGGTAAGSVDGLYEWSGDNLRLVEDNGIYEH